MIEVVEEGQKQSDEQWVNRVVRRMAISERARKPQEEKWLKCYKYYRAYRKFDADYWWRSQLFIPFIFAIVESICPHLIEALFGGENFFAVSDPTKRFTGSAENMQTLMRHQIDEKMEFFLKAVNWIKNTLIYGNGIVKSNWWKQEKTYPYRRWHVDPYFRIVTGSEMVKEKRTVYDDPILDTVELENFYPDPYGEGIKDCRYVIERKIVDYDYLVTMQKQKDEEGKGIYENVEAVKDSRFTGALPHFEKLSAVESGGGQPTGEGRKMVELLEYQEDDRFVTVANRKVLVRKPRDNPFWHLEKTYAMLKDYPLDKEFWAISTVEMLIPLQDKTNDLENLRIDNLVQALNRMYVVQRNKGLNADEFVSRPYGLIWSDDVNAVVPLIQAPIPREAFMERDVTKQDMERVSGAWEYASGATPQRKETATGIVRLQQAALKRFGLKIKTFQKTGFKEALQQIMQLNQQKMPRGYELFNGKEMMKLNPWDVQGKLLLTLTASSDLIGEKERFLALWDRVNGDPYFDQYKLREKLLDVFRLPGSMELLKKVEGMMGGVDMMAGAGVPTGEIPEMIPEMM